MPAFSASPFSPVKGLVVGMPAYSAGAGPGLFLSNCKMYVSQMSVTTNVVTLTVQIAEGNIPAVGDLVTVVGLPVAAANVGDVALASVTITANTGAGTITYAATTPNLGNTPCGGTALSKPAETAETSTPSAAYQAFAIPRSNPAQIAGRPVTCFVKYPSAPAAIKWNAQIAINNVDAEYASLGADQTAAGTVLFNVQNIYNFIRYKDTGSSGGTNPTVIAKFLI